MNLSNVLSDLQNLLPSNVDYEVGYQVIKSETNSDLNYIKDLVSNSQVSQGWIMFSNKVETYLSLNSSELQNIDFSFVLEAEFYSKEKNLTIKIKRLVGDIFSIVSIVYSTTEINNSVRVISYKQVMLLRQDLIKNDVSKINYRMIYKIGTEDFNIGKVEPICQQFIGFVGE